MLGQVLEAPEFQNTVMRMVVLWLAMYVSATIIPSLSEPPRKRVAVSTVSSQDTNATTSNTVVGDDEAQTEVRDSGKRKETAVTSQAEASTEDTSNGAETTKKSEAPVDAQKQDRLTLSAHRSQPTRAWPRPVLASLSHTALELIRCRDPITSASGSGIFQPRPPPLPVPGCIWPMPRSRSPTPPPLASPPPSPPLVNMYGSNPLEFAAPGQYGQPPRYRRARLPTQPEYPRGRGMLHFLLSLITADAQAGCGDADEYETRGGSLDSVAAALAQARDVDDEYRVVAVAKRGMLAAAAAGDGAHVDRPLRELLVERLAVPSLRNHTPDCAVGRGGSEGGYWCDCRGNWWVGDDERIYVDVPKEEH
ncbi:hypothetical protein F4780DRAFT_733141 [Xylariomycetidae sp. FL0641]|nr:hypothetical protein F4780DRAFT_733141 [Xylariomycetidae sp. FL0641]